jgi:hypothetical protein
MAKVYFLRHQARGVLHDLPFAQHPTKEQIAAVARLCAAAHGTHHPKTEEPYWLKVAEIEMVGPDFVIPMPAPAGVGKAELPGPVASGVGHVENPKS